MSLVHNERIKLAATALNNLAVANHYHRCPWTDRWHSQWLIRARDNGVMGAQWRPMVFRRNCHTFGGTGPSRETDAMTTAQLYFLIAPIVLIVVIGGGVGLWLYATKGEARRHTH